MSFVKVLKIPCVRVGVALSTLIAQMATPINKKKWN
jgi:hypothetical protein